jgi:hypothetical protein
MLLLRGGIVHGIPCTTTTSDLLCVPHLSSNHSWFIHQSPLAVTSTHLIAKQGQTWQRILPTKYLFHTVQGSSTCRKMLRHRTNGCTSPSKEVVPRILSPLNIHRPRPGLNSRTLVTMASTITTSPPSTRTVFVLLNCELRLILYSSTSLQLSLVHWLHICKRDCVTFMCHLRFTQSV